jgi:predicted transcriptional regulator
MQKIIEKPRGRSSEVAIRVKRTADIVGVSRRTVYRVIRGEETDKETVEKIMVVYMQLSEGETLLIKAVKKAVPFN